MIHLTCTSCQASLEMDDAFAGGVCRCQYCGTIQTVPSHLRSTAGAHPQPVGTAKTAKSLYPGRGTGGGGGGSVAPSSGLDQLADVVASSGLSSGGLTTRRPGAQHGPAGHGGGQGYAQGYAQPGLNYQTPQPRKGNKTLLFVLGGVGALVLVGGLAAVFLYSGRTVTTVGPAVPVNGAPAPTRGGNGGGNGGGSTTPGRDENGSLAPIAGPHFCSVPLSASRVVYVLDRGDASKSIFDPMKAALFLSLRSLGADKEFQVLFWKGSTDANVDEFAYPAGATAKATPDQVAACEKKLEDLVAGGATEITDALKAAVARAPGEIVIATPKTYLLPETMVAEVMQARGTAPIKVHTINLSGGDPSPVLKAIAEKTGGTYREVAPGELGRQ